MSRFVEVTKERSQEVSDRVDERGYLLAYIEKIVERDGSYVASVQAHPRVENGGFDFGAIEEFEVHIEKDN